MSIPTHTILVTVDVTNLYPSVPETKCLQIIYEEMFKKRHLLPNLIITDQHKLQLFSFSTLYFQQIHGTALVAAFSPTIANIFM